MSEPQNLTRWNPDSVAMPIGRYSHLSEVPPGHRLIFVSGQIGTDTDGVLAGPDAESQTGQAFANLERLLQSVDGTPEHIAKILTFVAGTECLPGFYAARDATFERWYPDGSPPAHSLAVVSALASPELLVEIEAVLAVPAR
jgi:2-iminobutanoate/2-iminopropanoate deaminase